MAIPGQSVTIPDPGLGLVEQADTTPLYLGESELGTANTIISFSTKNAAVTGLGQGPLSEAVCRCLEEAGGPVKAMRMTTTVTANNSVVTATPIGAATGTVTVAGLPFDSYEARIEILTTGTVGVGTFRYSLDDGNTFTEEIVIPAGGGYTPPSTNLIITFIPGVGPIFFEDGDFHEFISTASHYNAADIALAFAGIAASPEEFAFMVFTGIEPTGAAAVLNAAAIETGTVAMETVFSYVRSMADAGTDDTTAAVKTAWAAIEDARMSPCYGAAYVASSKPIPGWAIPRREPSFIMGARAARELISTDLARVQSGAIDGALSIEHDEFLSETMDVSRISTLRTWIGRPGFYITNQRLKSAPGSDFRYWQHGRIMDVATSTVYVAQQLFLSQGVLTNTDGTIEETEAQRFETRGESPLNAALLQPSNAEGQRGHVSDVSYTIDRTNNVATTEEILSEVSIRPLGYAKNITTTVGYSLTV